MDLLRTTHLQSLWGCRNIYAFLMRESMAAKSLWDAKLLHAHILARGLDSDLFLLSALLRIYTATCFCAADAQDNAYQALSLFQQMPGAGVKADRVSFSDALEACARVRSLPRGKWVHAALADRGFDIAASVGGSLVHMYTHCGAIRDARRVFDRTPARNSALWNVMITGYARDRGCGNQALVLFDEMQREGVKPNIATLVSLLKASAGTALQRGRQFHAILIKEISELPSNTLVGNTLIHMYAQCGSVENARLVFDAMQDHKTTVSWNAMIAGYAQCGHGNKAFALLQQMQEEAVKPNRVTFLSTLKACASMEDLEQGRQIHQSIKKNGLDADLSLQNSLLDLYAKCGSIKDAQEMFTQMRERDIVSWNVIIDGHVQCGHCKEALNHYLQMQLDGFQPNEFTFVSVLKACSSLASLRWGKFVDASINQKYYNSLGNSLIDMYSKCGTIENARRTFDRLHECRDVISWNTMIAGCVQNADNEEVLRLLDQMQEEDVMPDKLTLISALKACTNLASQECGKRVHASCMEMGFEADIFVRNSIIDMYAKCGNIEDAQRVFNKMSGHTVASWNAIIAGYGKHGLDEEVIALFQQMLREGIKPNDITIISVLSACRHAGLVGEGLHLFDHMSQNHGIAQTAKHYACIVDLLGQTGHLIEAEDLINKMPFQPDVAVWMSLLNACRSHGDEEVGQRVFEQILKLEPENLHHMF